MHFRILGPLEAVAGGRPLPLGGIRQRSVLGLLLLQPNRVVSTSKLMSAMWPEQPPASARKVVQNSIWSLRRLLASGEGGPEPSEHRVLLLTRAPGYKLCLDTDRVDLHRFQRLVEQGRAALAAGSPEQASLVLRQALDLCQGPVLADLGESGINSAELAAVQGHELAALEDYFEAELACGRHFSVLAELEPTARAHTQRERLCGQLMLALYRCGRQADALAVYQSTRTALREGYGLEPCHELRRLEVAILNQDPALVLPCTRIEYALLGRSVA
ncbi:AfsR/SARP family transcriptional regulator [Streptomyces sp. B-S-A8]|uniref:AfsR/SARP family transcriptional regulator n=1 Tax=Streptomyces solicavernae TaxID=3043614 RepID=A0ABT6RZV6_9ACTN|nr:AfsR/SARP family transcriptional regulator [Streptomyces sp. B-S-A8]MDI3389973.1 AfsR/SARP family transcriptional regulator [Streptomyces sp. B-S-A8]